MLDSHALDFKKAISSSDSLCENLSFEDDFLMGFKSILEIKDNEEPSIQTRRLCNYPQEVDRHMINGYQNQEDNILDVLYDCSNSDSSFLSKNKYSNVQGRISKKTSLPSHLHKYFIINKNAPNYQHRTNEKAERLHFYSCPKSIRDRNYLSQIDYSRPLLDQHDSSRKRQYLSLEAHPRRIFKNNSQLNIHDKSSLNSLNKQLYDENYNEKSIEVMRIFKKANNINEKDENGEIVLSEKNCIDIKTKKKSKTKKGNKHTSLAEDETFFRFDRRGWICIHCLNFNFESKPLISC